jgi:ABC-type antimicrobial peptide transport system permease subunit
MPANLITFGGGASNHAMESLSSIPSLGIGTLLDQAVEKGMVPPMVSVMPSAGRSFYMNFRDGSQKWEDLVLDDLLSYMRKNFNVVDHVGASLAPRSLDAFAFIGRQLNPPKWIDDAVLRFRAIIDEAKKERGYPVTPFDPNRIHAE